MTRVNIAMRRFFGRRKSTQRVLLLGLDCASPNLIFEQFTDELPTLRSLMQNGTWGELESSIPCITVPAWSSMMTSRDPGVLGIYGFRNRADYSYDALTTANSTAVQHPRVWDILGDAGKQSLIMNVPQTYPVKPLNGSMISGFLTPNTGAQFAYPAIFKQEVLKIAPDYDFDVRNFRHIERAELLQKLIDLTVTQYRVLEYALMNKDWDFAMHVNIGVDRIHHAFWRYHDEQHRLHEADSPFQNVIQDYYQLVDKWLERILNQIGDDVVVIIASDHGVKRMDGAIAINEWLWRNGWLNLKSTPDSITKFSHDMVDWSQTKAWSTGGYYGRIFLNVAGREPQGIISMNDYEKTRDELAYQLKTIPDDKQNALDTQVFKPQDIYEDVRHIAPDLIVYFGDLHWRTVGSVGYGKHYTLENDTGPDDANHAQNGMFILHHPKQHGRGQVTGYQLMDIAPTILDILGVSIPKSMQGKVITF